MSKSVRIDFTGGIALVPDKAVSGGNKYVSVADNVDLRSGLPRCINAPSLIGPANRGSIHFFNYRGKTWQSSADRHYVGIMSGNTELVYWTEEGQYPMKSVNGVTAALGTIVPKAAPSVTGVAGALVVTSISVAAERNAGNLSAGENSYRIAVKKDGAIYAPSGGHCITTQQGDAVTIEWGQVDEADSYIIFGRTSGEERVLVEVSPGTTSWRDNGTVAENGSFAKSYEMDSAVRYACTFARDIGGVRDESGLGPPSLESPSASARKLSFDLDTDGYFDQPMLTVVSEPDVIVYDSASVARQYNIIAMSINSVTGRVEVEVASDHGLETGAKVRFSLTDPAWSGIVATITVVSDTKFSVSGRPLPSDSMPVSNGVQVIETAVEIIGVDEMPGDGDPVYLSGSKALELGLFGSHRVSMPALGTRLRFRIPVWCDAYFSNSGGLSSVLNAKFVVCDGRIAYRRIYRSGDTGEWLLVDEIDAHVSTYEDAKPTISLGEPPSSFYNDGMVDVNFGPPPKGLTNVVEHMGMLFGIDGNRVRWTPPGEHDAWPEVYSTPAMEYKPVELLPAGPLMVFCEDRVLRLDGSTPSSMTLTNTNISDGCFAPKTAKSTPIGIMWLARRGVMVSDGMDATCITESRISGDFFSKRNKYGWVVTEFGSIELSKPYGVWYPTVSTANYAEAHEDGFYGNDYPNLIWTSNIGEGVTDHIAAFLHNGKYTLYWRDLTPGEFEAHTAMQIDLQMEGRPITTMGLKAAWVDVDSLDVPRALVITGMSEPAELVFLATLAVVPGGTNWSSIGSDVIKIGAQSVGLDAVVSSITFSANIGAVIGPDDFYITVKKMNDGTSYTMVRGDSRLAITGDSIVFTPSAPLNPSDGRYVFEMRYDADVKRITLIPWDSSLAIPLPVPT